jgi:glycosidase
MPINQQDIIYFILTDRFNGKGKSASTYGLDKKNPTAYHGGNFDGIIEKIPYLKKLGITALWITPVYWQVNMPLQGAQSYHGYWALDFNKVDPHLYVDKGYEQGSRKYLKELVDELHKNSIKLVLDVVVNHAGYSHPGQSNKSDNPTPIRSDWFNQQGLSSDVDVIHGELSGLPDFDLDKLDVVDYHIESMIAWIRETGIDAVRMDTAKHVEKQFWNYYKTQIHGRFPEVSLIGEVLVYSIDELTSYQKFWGFDSLFDFPVQETIIKVFAHGLGLTEFYSPFNVGNGIFERDTAYSNQNRLISLLDNHDLPFRFMTAALDASQGDYTKATMIMKIALTFIFTTRGIPQIYYGTEVGLEGRNDPDNRRDFPWEKFDDKLEVKKEYPYEKDIFDHIRKLIEMRKSSDALNSGTFVCLYVDYFIFVYLNYFDENFAITCIHNGWDDMPGSLSISVENNPQIPRRVKDLIKNKVFTCKLTGKKIEMKNGVFSIGMEKKTSMVLI